MTIREAMADWCDWDDAAHAYGAALGIFDDASRRQVTRVVLSDNPLGNALHDGMMALVAGGVVERREEPFEQFRWVFDGSSLPRMSADVATPQTGDGPAQPEWTAAGPPAPAKRWWRRG